MTPATRGRRRITDHESRTREHRTAFRLIQGPGAIRVRAVFARLNAGDPFRVDESLGPLESLRHVGFIEACHVNLSSRSTRTECRFVSLGELDAESGWKGRSNRSVHALKDLYPTADDRDRRVPISVHVELGFCPSQNDITGPNIKRPLRVVRDCEERLTLKKMHGPKLTGVMNAHVRVRIEAHQRAVAQLHGASFAGLRLELWRQLLRDNLNSDHETQERREHAEEAGTQCAFKSICEPIPKRSTPRPDILPSAEHVFQPLPRFPRQSLNTSLDRSQIEHCLHVARVPNQPSNEFTAASFITGGNSHLPLRGRNHELRWKRVILTHTFASHHKTVLISEAVGASQKGFLSQWRVSAVIIAGRAWPLSQ